jgi:hypothetical protein
MNGAVEKALTKLANAYRMVICAPGEAESLEARAEVRQCLGEAHTALGDQVAAWRSAFAEELRHHTAADACWLAWRRVEGKGQKEQGKSETFRTAFA